MEEEVKIISFFGFSFSFYSSFLFFLPSTYILLERKWKADCFYSGLLQRKKNFHRSFLIPFNLLFFHPIMLRIEEIVLLLILEHLFPRVCNKTPCIYSAFTNHQETLFKGFGNIKYVYQSTSAWIKSLVDFSFPFLFNLFVLPYNILEYTWTFYWFHNLKFTQVEPLYLCTQITLWRLNYYAQK